MRKERGLTLEAFATRAKISYQYLSGVETGKENFSIGVLDAVAAALGLPLNALILTAYELQDGALESSQLEAEGFRGDVPMPVGLRPEHFAGALADAVRTVRRIGRNFNNHVRRPLHDFLRDHGCTELVAHSLGIALSQHSVYKLRAADGSGVLVSNGRGRRGRTLELRACRGADIGAARGSGATGWYALALFDCNQCDDMRVTRLMVAHLHGAGTPAADWLRTDTSAEARRANGHCMPTASGVAKLLEGSIYCESADEAKPGCDSAEIAGKVGWGDST
ncbi:MAG: helix-turn-helix transcriptional regulator [Gammaproteobacteria bacterium]|nr:helix-turn-helix transcriptional regulator [Gammaproteobacteria bacterium]